MTSEEPAGTPNVISGGIQFGPVLQGRDIRATFQLPAAAPTALAQLPPEVTGFTGRDDELAVLAGMLDPARAVGAVVVSAVAGLAGVGKTALAVQAGHAARQRGWCQGGVLFLDLHGYDEAPVQPGQALDALLRALGVPAEHIPPGVEERAVLYRSVLAEIADPVLVIADNASSEVQVRPLLPGIGPHKVVVTSRHTLAGLDARLVDVTVLDEEAAVGLLEAALRAARPEDDRISTAWDAAVRLARLCEGLPLALQIAAALLKADPALSAAELVQELAVESARLEQLAYDDGSGTGAPSVAAAFELSYRRLEGTHARVFRLMPVNPGSDVSTAAVAVLADLPVARVRRVLAGLTQAHLTEAAAGASGRWRMHDLVRLYAQRLSDGHADADERAQAEDRLLSYYVHVAEAANLHMRALPGVVVPAEFTGRDTALEWLDAERTSLVAAVSMAAATGRDQASLSLFHALAPYMNWRRLFGDWLAITDVVLEAAQRLGDRRREGDVLGTLGAILHELRRFDEAITVYQEAAAIFRETGDRSSEGDALTNIGLTMNALRRFDEAITAHQEAAAIFRDIGKPWDQSVALDNLGLVLRDIRRFDEALTAHQKAAAIFRRVGDQHRLSTALTNLGIVLRHLRRYRESIAACQDAVAICRETGERHGEGVALASLGLALREAGRAEEAITAYQGTIAIDRETGDRHGEGIALANLGDALGDAGRFEEAIAACQDAVAICRETGDRHGAGRALSTLSVALAKAGRPGEAITTCREAAAVFRETGDRHSEGRVLDYLGVFMRKAGRLDQAIAAHQEATAIFRETGDRYGGAYALYNLGLALHDVGRFVEAIAAHEEAAAIFEETGDVAHLGLVLRVLEAFRGEQQA